MEAIAFVVLRVVLAWIFLYPLKALLSDWEGTVDLVGLIAPCKPHFFAVIMVLVMIAGSLSVLLGFYAQIGAILLFVYSLIGFVVHYKLSQQEAAFELSAEASESDKAVLEQAKGLGIVGHVTSAQKNIVIAAALWVIIFLGSGPYSLIGNLF